MRNYILACAAALGLLGAAGPRASAGCCFSIHFSCCHECHDCGDCCYANPDERCYCGWPGYHLDGSEGHGMADGGYPVADYGYPAAYPAEAPSGQPFPPAPQPVGGPTSSFDYPGYGGDASGYASTGGYGPSAPSYWYGR